MAKKILIVVIITLWSAVAVAKTSSFSWHLDYVPSTVFSAIDWFGESGTLAHGGGLTLDWHGEDAWGAQGFVSYHHISDVESMSLGGNAVCHLRYEHHKADPYLLAGVQAFFSLEDSNRGGYKFLPVVNIGAGTKFMFTEHLGFHVDATASPLFLVLPLVILEGKAGLVLTF